MFDLVEYFQEALKLRGDEEGCIALRGLWAVNISNGYYISSPCGSTLSIWSEAIKLAGLSDRRMLTNKVNKSKLMDMDSATSKFFVFLSIPQFIGAVVHEQK